MCCLRGDESMSLSPQIRAIGGMYNVGSVSKAGCTNGIDGIVPAGNTNSSPEARSG